MWRRAWPFALILLTAGLCVNAQEPATVRFEDIPRLVEANNLHAKGAALALKAVNARRGPLRRSFLPTASAEAGAESFTTGDGESGGQPFGGVEARLNVFNGGRDALGNKMHAERARIAQAAARRALADEIAKARRAFWAHVSQEEKVGLIHAALQQNADNRAAANKRIRAGLSTETDRLEFDIQEIELHQDLARLQLERANRARALRVLLGFPAAAELAVATTVPHIHEDELWNVSPNLSRQRDVQAAHAAAHLATFEAAEARRWWAPAVDVYGGYWLFTEREREFPDREHRDDSAVGLRARLDLFDGLRGRTNARSAALEAQGREAEALQTQMEKEAELEGIKEELKTLHALVHDAERGVDLGSRYLRKTLEEYARGVKNSPDVRDATEKHFNMRRRLIELRHDYQGAKAGLLDILDR